MRNSSCRVCERGRREPGRSRHRLRDPTEMSEPASQGPAIDLLAAVAGSTEALSTMQSSRPPRCTNLVSSAASTNGSSTVSASESIESVLSSLSTKLTESSAVGEDAEVVQAAKSAQSPSLLKSLVRSSRAASSDRRRHCRVARALWSRFLHCQATCRRLKASACRPCRCKAIRYIQSHCPSRISRGLPPSFKAVSCRSKYAMRPVDR